MEKFAFEDTPKYLQFAYLDACRDFKIFFEFWQFIDKFEISAEYFFEFKLYLGKFCLQLFEKINLMFIMNRHTAYLIYKKIVKCWKFYCYSHMHLTLLL